MRELSLHVLDIAQNSIAAGATNVSISITEDSRLDLLQIKITDNGKGMDADLLSKVADPFTTSRLSRKVGLGIPLLKEAAEACNGSFSITSKPGMGTQLEINFQRSHIDRMPMGDIQTTLLSLVTLNPDLDFLFHYQIDDRSYFLDTGPIKKELEDVSLSDPLVIKYLRESISEGLADLHQNNS